MALKAMCKFLNNLEPKKVFAIFTHCDVQPPKDANIREKLAMFERYSGLNIPLTNVIKFGNVRDQLLPLFATNI